jgi:Domain of unknown function (DUF4864)
MHRRITVFVLLLGLLAGVHAAEPVMRLSPKKIRDEVQAVVQAQLSALRAGDFAAAYDLASAGIKEQFDERLFALMIRRGYPALLTADTADLGVVRDRDGEEAQVTVAVPDKLKRSLVFRYWLVHEEEGWRINAVALEQRPPRGDT